MSLATTTTPRRIVQSVHTSQKLQVVDTAVSTHTDQLVGHAAKVTVSTDLATEMQAAPLEGKAARDG